MGAMWSFVDKRLPDHQLWKSSVFSLLESFKVHSIMNEFHNDIWCQKLPQAGDQASCLLGIFFITPTFFLFTLASAVSPFISQPRTWWIHRELLWELCAISGDLLFTVSPHLGGSHEKANTSYGNHTCCCYHAFWCLICETITLHNTKRRTMAFFTRCDFLSLSTSKYLLMMLLAECEKVSNKE